MPETGVLRQPLAWVVLDSGRIPVLECEVNQLGSQGGGVSTFEAHIALDDPASPSAGWWSSTQQIAVEIVGDNGDGTGEAVLIAGAVDKVHIDFGPRIVHIEGRGPEGTGLADQRTDQNYVNQPIASIVSQIASKAGLGVFINAPDSGNMAGRTYDHQNYSFLTDMQNGWDALQQLASEAGARVFVHGQNLYFVNGSAGGGSYEVVYVPPTSQSYDESNAVKILATHDTSAGADQVTATSFHSYDKEAHTAEGDGGGAGSVGGEGLGIIGGGYGSSPGGDPGAGNVPDDTTGPHVDIGMPTITEPETPAPAPTAPSPTSVPFG